MISEAALAKKVREWSHSSSGKKRIDEYISTLADSGGKTVGGRNVIGPAQMKEAASLFIGILRSKIPAQIASTGDTLRYSNPVKTPYGYVVTVQFDSEALKRESLKDWGQKYDGHTGPGIRNIVALFNNGYANDPIKPVSGYWASHDVYTWSRTSWDGLGFMQDTAEEFNRLYGEKYNVTIELGSDYGNN